MAATPDWIAFKQADHSSLVSTIHHLVTSTKDKKGARVLFIDIALAGQAPYCFKKDCQNLVTLFHIVYETLG
jgi:hypothetical protein